MLDIQLMACHLGPLVTKAEIPHLSQLQKLPKKYHKHFNIDKDYTWDDLLNLEIYLNNYGFRSYEDYHLENEPNEAWCFGCSHTAGFGLPLHHTWPHILEKQIELKTKNFGVAGSGADMTWRLIENWVKYSTHKPEHVYIFGFHHPRFSVYDGSQYININASTKEAMTKDLDKPLLKIIDKKWNEMVYENIPKEEAMIKEFLDKHKIKHSIVNPSILLRRRLDNAIENSKTLIDIGNDVLDMDDFLHIAEHGFTLGYRSGAHPGLNFQKEVVQYLLKG